MGCFSSKPKENSVPLQSRTQGAATEGYVSSGGDGGGGDYGGDSGGHGGGDAGGGGGGGGDGGGTEIDQEKRMRKYRR